ncbi:MAG: UDP-N-acetylmuramate--L-alanine ligase [Phycisphaeraceae bacterium]|nr:UDP-N-acetylmuramate--L-alanine ligase [Phycisphaeraceae bacterium]
MSMTHADPAATGSRRLQLKGQHLHFVGIGGCGMSGLARICQQQGAIVSGCDGRESDTMTMLRDAGIEVSTDQSAEALQSDVEMLVISAAIDPAHAQVVAARKRNIVVFKYAQLLGLLMLGRTAVAVAGTHGKSSTTSMLSHILIQANLDPTIIVGAVCPQIGGGWRVGGSDLIVAEACEFDRSFHNFHPTHALILNVEADHLDIYKSLEEIVESFARFARKTPHASAGGTLLINHEMPHRLPITAGLDCQVKTIGFAPQADWRVGVKDDLARLHHGDEVVMDWRSPLPGEHMAYNAAAAAVTAHRLGASWTDIAAALESFRGLERRMQQMGTRQGVKVIDDYGHHPTEIDTTLRALRRHEKPQRLICVFQPHQHSRTRFLLDEFAASFSAADIVIVPDIYFVRDSEVERHAVTAADLVDRLRNRGVTAMHMHPFAAIVEQLQVMTREGDLVVTMGAGDVWKIAKQFLISVC